MVKLILQDHSAEPGLEPKSPNPLLFIPLFLHHNLSITQCFSHLCIFTVSIYSDILAFLSTLLNV